MQYINTNLLIFPLLLPHHDHRPTSLAWDVRKSSPAGRTPDSRSTPSPVPVNRSLNFGSGTAATGTGAETTTAPSNGNSAPARGTASGTTSTGTGTGTANKPVAEATTTGKRRLVDGHWQ